MAKPAPAAPFASIAIAAATAAFFLWLDAMPDEAFLRRVEAWGLKPGSQPVSLVASAVVHKSWAHLGLNMVLLLAFGPAVEKRVRSWGLALLYVLAGVAGAASHLAWMPPGLRMMTLVGASGAVSGVIGAHAVLRPWGRTSVAFALGWAALNLAGLLLLDRGGAREISYLSHLGGLAAGAAIAAALLAIRPAKARKAP